MPMPQPQYLVVPKEHVTVCKTIYYVSNDLVEHQLQLLWLHEDDVFARI